MGILQSQLNVNKSFSLDSSGIAGFFGGEEAFAAMNSVHFIPSRRWMGWYNSPGSYFVAKKYGTLPNSIFWDGLFPGPPIDPADLLEIDKKPGSRYIGVYSGTQLYKTGHLSYLISRFCRDPGAGITGPGTNITVLEFSDVADEQWGERVTIPDSYLPPIPQSGVVLIFFTMIVSLSFAILSALYADWFSFAMILYGAIANGTMLQFLGKGVLSVDLSQSTKTAPPGDGVLWDARSIIILKGPERVINTILHSRFRLQYANDPKYHKIGACCILLLAQFLLQLLLIPQGLLLGQVLFLATLAVSWVCNGYLASKDLEAIQAEILFRVVGRPAHKGITMRKWSEAVVFAMFYFSFAGATPEGVLNELMSNNTPAWNLWKQCVCEAVRRHCAPSTVLFGGGVGEGTLHEGWAQLSSNDREFVRLLIGYADGAYASVGPFKSAFRRRLEEDEGLKTDVEHFDVDDKV